MVDDRKQLDRYLDQYDELAVTILDDPRPNTNFGLPWSNQELTQIVLEDMDWEFFDVFQPMDYARAYESESAEIARAFCFVAFLRMMLFSAAFQTHLGEPEFNKLASAQSEYWFKRLKDRYESLTNKEESKQHKWIN